MRQRTAITRVHATGFYSPDDWTSPKGEGRGSKSRRHINILASNWDAIYKLELVGAYGEYSAVLKALKSSTGDLEVLRCSMPKGCKLVDAKRTALRMAHAYIRLDPIFKHTFIT